MTYERKQMLDAIIAVSWREMDAFASRVADYYDDQPDGTADNPRAWMARALVKAAEDEKGIDAEREAAAKAAKPS